MNTQSANYEKIPKNSVKLRYTSVSYKYFATNFLQTKKGEQLLQQLTDIHHQKELAEKEIGDLREQLRQAQEDAASLVTVADKLRKRDRKAQAQGQRTRSQLDHLSKIMNAIAKQEHALGLVSGAEDNSELDIP